MTICLYCHQDMQAGQPLSQLLFGGGRQVLCARCRALLTPIAGPTCQECGRTMDQEGRLCPDCQAWLDQGEAPLHNLALFHYDDQAKDWASRYKFMGDCLLADMIKRDLRRGVQAYRRRGYVLCPLPSSEASRQTRQFEAVAYLCQVAQVPTVSLLEHRGQGPKQSTKNRQQRLALSQPFVWSGPDNPPKKVLLIDDVYTTGRTIRHACQCLRQSGVEAVSSLTIFR